MTTTTAGDRQWVLSVLEEYETPLLRFATRLLGDESSAHDAVQHTFLRLCEQSAEKLRDRVAPWLFTVCRNKAVDMLRVQRRLAPMASSEIPPTVSKEPDPAETAGREELYRRLNRLVDELPINQREAVSLWSEGFSYRDIAGMTQRTEVNVRVLVHRGIKRLRENPTARQLVGATQAEQGIQGS
jgi:RNA polymerase sigma-70 factor (ECF subfamily)